MMRHHVTPSLRRRLLAIVGSVTLTSLLLAPTAFAARPAAHPHDTVTITWLMRIDPNENPWERAEVKGFEAANPGIKINLITAPNPNNGFDIKFNTLLQSGTPADIWSHLGQAGFADYYHRGLLLNLSPLIKSMNYNFGSTPKNLINTYNIGGNIYGIPSITLDSFLFYNKDIFDDYNKAHPNAKIAYPPVNWDDRSWTWDKMVNDAKLLTNPANHTYGLLENLWPYMHWAWWASEDFWPKSAYQTGLPKKANLLQPGIIKYVSLVANYESPKGLAISPPQSLIRSIGNTGADPFQFGNIAMGMTGGWGFRNFRPQRFHWAAAAIPWTPEQLAKGGPRDTLFTDPYMVYKGTKHPQEVFKFIQYLTNSASMNSYIQNVGFTPSNPDYLGQWYSQYSKITGLSVEQLKTLVQGGRKYGFESPNHLIVNFATINQTLQQDFDPILNGDKPVKAGLLQAQTDLNKILANTK